jgi:hypothetical protein
MHVVDLGALLFSFIASVEPRMQNATYTRVHVYITGITVNPDSDHGIHVHLVRSFSFCLLPFGSLLC